MTCRICDKENVDTRHLPIYVEGSEGTHVCFDCEMMIVDFIRKIMAACGRTKIQTVKRIRGIEKGELK